MANSGWVADGIADVSDDGRLCFRTKRLGRLFFIAGTYETGPRRGEGFWLIRADGVPWLHLSGTW